MHTVIIKGTQFNVSTLELEQLLKTSYYDSYTSHTNGSQRQFNLKGIDMFTVVSAYALDTAGELIDQFITGTKI